MSTVDFLCELQEVAKHIPGRTLFQNVNFVFNYGDVVSLTGNNGEGKTTLLRIVSGAIRPSTGAVTHRPNIRIGYAPAAENVFFSRLTGRENLTFFANLQKVSKQELKAEMDRWSERPNFKKALETHYFLSSSGMKQILNLFRAFLGSPELILLDEPMQSLDQDSVKFFIERIKSAKNSAVLLTSHQPQLLASVSRKSYLLKEGEICLL